MTPLAVGAAIQRPVVKHCELAVGGRMNVELDDIGAGRETGSHRADCILQILVRRRQHPRRGAGVILQVAFVEALGDAAMCEQDGLAVVMGGEMIGVVDVDGCGEDDDRHRDIFEFLVQGLPPRTRCIR